MVTHRQLSTIVYHGPQRRRAPRKTQVRDQHPFGPDQPTADHRVLSVPVAATGPQLPS
jgi:hypothetical protein